LAGPSFHDGNGSDWAANDETSSATNSNPAIARRLKDTICLTIRMQLVTVED
jgi:hypothetical protein